MRFRFLHKMLLATALIAGIGSAAAQTFSLNWNPRSGDVWVDTWLGDMNRYGTHYRDPFIDEMVRYHSAPRDLVTELLVQRRWAPGERSRSTSCSPTATPRRRRSSGSSGWASPRWRWSPSAAPS